MGKWVFLFLLIGSVLNAQMTVSLKSRDTGQPISYANVWEGNSLVAASDSLGVFYVTDKPDIEYRISAIGYQTLTTKITEPTTLFLSSAVIPLENIAVAPRKDDKSVKLGKLKNGDVSIVCTLETLVPLIAKYFPNDDKQGFYLDRVKFKGFSSAKNRVASISVFSVGDDGKPYQPIGRENVVCRFKKGHQTINVDLKKLNIPFPDNGIFIVFNYLPLEQNKYYVSEKKTWFFYEPSLDAVANNGAPDWWNFTAKGWELQNKYSLSMQLILRN